MNDRSPEFYIGFCPSWRSLIIRDVQIRPNTKLVLLVIAEFASGMGRMQWPSKQELCLLTGLEMKQIETALKYARDYGYLQFTRATYGGDSGYEPRVPANPACMELWTAQPKGQSGPVFQIPGKDILAEVLDATACHALIDALAESRKVNATTSEQYIQDPDEEDTEGVADGVQEAAREPAPQPDQHRARRTWA